MGKNYTAGAELLAAVVPRSLAGMRLDQALAKMFPQYSRNRLQAWLKSGHVRVKRGATDVQARWFSQKLTAGTGRQFVVDNRAGAGGLVA